MSFGLSVKKEMLSHCACVKWTAMVQFASVRDTRRRGSMNVAIRSPAHFYFGEEVCIRERPNSQY